MFEYSRAANPVALERGLSQQRHRACPLPASGMPDKAQAPAFIAPSKAVQRP